MEHTRRTSGTHLEAIRRWMQNRFVRGDRVTWNSDDSLLNGPSDLTPKIFEEAAQVVRDKLVQEFAKFIQHHIKMRSKDEEFVPNPSRPQMCEKCGKHKDLHDLLQVLNDYSGEDFRI